MEPGYELSLCIPFFNEEENVEHVLSGVIETIQELDIPFEIIAVDNGSRDRTREIITQLMQTHPQIKLVVVETNEGYGWGIISGLSTAQGRVIGYSDGDGQIDPKTINDSYLGLINEDNDVQMAVRTVRKDPLGRKILSIFYRGFFSLMFRYRPRDINGKPKLMKMKCWEALEIESKDWFIDTEIIIKSKEKNYKIGYVDMGFGKRKGGSSSITPSVIMEFLSNTIKLKVRGHLHGRR